MPLPPPCPREVALRVVAHFRAHRRDLPWRRTGDPYAVWVSEVMLQQTRVAAVVPYFERWLARFPTVESLAAAPLDDVLSAWSGLGYYSRARNLHRGAREVVARYGGALPAAAKQLRALPGIGRYTAGAIASIAFDRPEPLVDGNVARVLARLYEIDQDVKASATVARLWSLAAALVPDDAPGDFNQGLMELGATVCTPTRPACPTCPLADLCRARAAGTEESLPVVPARKRAAELPLLCETAAWVERRGRLLLARRRPEGLYGGLWELPQAPSPADLSGVLGAAAVTRSEPVAEHFQVLSHRRLQIRVHVAELAGRAPQPAATAEARYDRLAWRRLGELGATGISAATRAILEQYWETNRWSTTRPPSTSSSRATKRSSRASAPSATTRSRTTRTSRRPPAARPRGSTT